MEFKRIVAKERKINEIQQDDIRVKVLGRVIDKTDNIFIIDDGSAKAEVLYDQDIIKKDFKIGDNLKLFARVLLSEPSNVQLQAEAIQNINDLNLDLYRRIKEVIKNV